MLPSHIEAPQGDLHDVVGAAVSERHVLAGDVMIAPSPYPTVRSASATVPVAGVSPGDRNKASTDQARGSLPLWLRYQWAMNAEPGAQKEARALPDLSACWLRDGARSLMTRSCRWRSSAHFVRTRPKRSFPKQHQQVKVASVRIARSAMARIFYGLNGGGLRPTTRPSTWRVGARSGYKRLVHPSSTSPSRRLLAFSGVLGCSLLRLPRRRSGSRPPCSAVARWASAAHCGR